MVLMVGTEECALAEQFEGTVISNKPSSMLAYAVGEGCIIGIFVSKKRAPIIR
jgi:hypothetical protein